MTATLYINWRLSLPIIIILVLFVTNYNTNIGKIRRAWMSVRNSEDRLASGIQDTHPLPVYGILNSRPFGPCLDTDVALDQVEWAINEFLA